MSTYHVVGRPGQAWRSRRVLQTVSPCRFWYIAWLAISADTDRAVEETWRAARPSVLAVDAAAVDKLGFGLGAGR